MIRVLLATSLAGVVELSMAVVVHEGSTVIVVLNTLW